MGFELCLLRRLVALNTDSETKENYEKCARLIAAEARKAGLKAKIFRAKAPDGKPRPNVLIELNAGAPETLLLLAHFDIVAPGSGWRTSPFKVVKKGNALYGRGVGDDKGAIVAALCAMRELKKALLRRNVKLVAGCDEEVGGRFGMGFLAKKHWREIKADCALVLDAGTSEVTVGCSGTPRGYIILKGTQGHGGYPFQVPNVIHRALPFLQDLKDYKKIAEQQTSKFNAPQGSPRKKMFGRFSITVLHSGYKLNVIPGELRIGFDLRVIPEADVRKERRKFWRYAMKSMRKHDLKGKIEWIGEGGYGTNPLHPFVKELLQIAGKAMHKKLKAAVSFGGEDGRHLAPKGIPVAGFGPGGKNPHSSKESITLRELGITKEVIKKLCT
ncbi:MAG: M20/M25/M40 family metallo-hydrolase [Candidatus Diapherotrites archaeon]|nr:M20/M25/M40 family metallo-hydrolase [Candidatus Diapherotrites archaeon]